MSPHRARLLAGLALVVALAPACSRAYAPEAEPAVAQTSNLAPGFVLAQAPLFERLQRAPLNVAHSGMRRLEYHYEIAGVPHSLVYEERVSADGHGRFALDPVRIGEPQMTVGQREVFDLVQKNREGFFFNYRDFGVRNTALFLSNYTITDLGSNPVVVGRACTEIMVKRNTSARVTYRLAVDVETGLILRSVETSPSGNVTALAEFTSISIGPVPQDVAWFDGQHSGELLDTTGQIDQGLRFTPITPRLLPQGYQLLKSEIVREGGSGWVRHTYSDGVETLFVLHTGELGLTGTFATDTAPGAGVNRLPLPDQAEVAPIVPATYDVRLLDAGPWTLAEVTRGQTQIFVVGKIGEDDVLRVLQSSL